MQVNEAIMRRRSIGRVKPDPVDKALIEQMLTAAVCAPNHYKTEPWRFFVMTGQGRKVLGQAYAAIAREEMDDPDSEENLKALQKQEEKAFRAPVIIAVAVQPSEDQRVKRIEELAAVHAAIQNMLLTAHALGLGAIWRTGSPAYHPKMKQAFGLKGDSELAGLIYVGYPLHLLPESERPSFVDKTQWLV